MRCLPALLLGIVTAAVFHSAFAQEKARPKPYRLPSVDLKERIIWGAVCELPDGSGLAFGGQDQHSDDGIGHTRIKINGQWQDIHAELCRKNPLQPYHERCLALARLQKEATARARAIYFSGSTPVEEARRVNGELVPLLTEKGLQQYTALVKELGGVLGKLEEQEKQPARLALAELQRWGDFASLLRPLSADTIRQLHNAQVAVEKAAEFLDAEPPPRALSPLVYDAQTRLYVLFGGDHLDYLTNDTWVFDPARRRWKQLKPSSAPPPRANHTLRAAGDGKIILTGGYTYTSATGYISGQYIDLDDGEWTFDLATHTWSGKDKGVAPNQRVYRTGPFHPDFYLQGAKPDAAAVAERLQELPANTWVALKPPHLPRLNRDWGTAVLDTDRDLILRFSGGHSAHGGTDVLHYHLATNRWELCFPVEFPLGQLYSNTSYPEGFNFNRRPWVTGHTYQNYGYDPLAKKMFFTGQHEYCYIYDPVLGDWTGRFLKPRGMIYNSCFYTLTLTPTPRGLVCWTQNGQLYRLESSTSPPTWVELKLDGKLPGSVVDNSTVIHDTKRDRLLFFRKGYGEKYTYDGQIHTVDCRTLAVETLSPEGREPAAAIPYLCQIRYDAANDLFLVGGTLPPGSDGLRRTPAYDPARNRWVSLRISGDDPSGKNGRNVSLGLMYDARRRLFWAVDTNSNVFVLRLDPASADLQPLR